MNKPVANNTQLHEQILQSMLASFRIEGIHISDKQAREALAKVKLSLGKQGE